MLFTFGGQSGLMMAVSLKVLIVVSLVFAGFGAWGPWQAARLTSTPTPDRLERALQWDPQNSQIHAQLALYQRDSLESRDLQSSSKSLVRAIELNPHSWQYRFEAGRLWELLDEPEKAEHAYRVSVELNTVSSRSHWRLANFYLRMARLEDALPEVQAAMLKEPALQETAFALLSSFGAEAESILRVWPPDHSSQVRLLRILCRDGAVAKIGGGANLLGTVWQSVLEGPDRVSLEDGASYFDYLRRHATNDRARSAWTELMHNRGNVDPDFESGRSEVWNGRFELPISQTGLGWSIARREGIRTSLDSEDCSEGTSCLRVEFDGTENPTSIGIEKAVLVDPSSAYRLAFTSRSLGLSTDQGLFLEVIDLATGDRLLTTEPISGTSPWRYHEATLEIGEGVSELSIRVRRAPSRRLDYRLSGTFWLDEVTLEEMAN